MNQEWLVLLGAVLQPALLVLVMPRRWLRAAMLVWLALPLPVFVFVVLHEMATRPTTPMAGDTVAFAAGLFAITYGVGWAIASGLGFALGLWLRRRLRPGERAAAAAPPPPAAAAPVPPPSKAAAPFAGPMAAPAAPRPRREVVLPNSAGLSQAKSPDGRIRVDIAEVEWSNTHWIRSPRVIDAASGAMLLDLWDTPWDAELRFPAPGVVWLGLRHYRSTGAWTAEIELDRGIARLRRGDVPGGAAEEMPIAALEARLEAVAAQATREAMLVGTPIMPPPPRFAAWRTALVILVLALAAIAGLTWLSLPAPPPPPPAPPIPAVPRVPDPPGFRPPTPASPEPPPARPVPPAR